MRFDLSRPVPILLLGDAVDSLSGLGRIAHDVGWILSTMPEFRVGILSRAGVGRAHFPWVSYSYPASGQWGEDYLETCFRDLAQGQRGIVMTLWDPSRLLWFSSPAGMSDSLQNFLNSGVIERWSVFMQDCEGVRSGFLPLTAAEVMSKYNRVLLASKFAYNLTKATMPDHPAVDWLPHPLNVERFSPRDRMAARSHWGVSEKEILIGCIQTNQARKHWPVVLEAIASMRPTAAGKVKLWAHTDIAMPKPGHGYFNLPALIYEYGLQDQVILDTSQLSDTDMAYRYSACDATVLISGSEGFAYPIAESLSCGVPVVSGSYSASGDMASHLVQPSGYRIDTPHNVRYALYSAPDVARKLEEATDQVRSGDWEIEHGRERTAHLAGNKLGVLYQKYFRKGLQ